ncbi:MAG: NAD(P)-dependent oxidoreductase, partial [Elusimicrobia bacterium]|nr:NAD(P)-dependent oxidoreductase [Elusimicrobiota bacterium]
VDVIVHNAGLIRGKKSEYYLVNAKGTYILVEKAKKLKNLKKFILISSQAASGPAPLSSPKKETDPENPVSDYGKSKLLGEKIVKKSGLPYIILRPCAVYGPGDRDIFFAFQLVKRGFVPLPQGKRFLNLVNVFDVCGAVLRAVEGNLINETFFVAHPEILTYESVIKKIAEKMNKKIFIVKIPEPVIYFSSIFLSSVSYITGKTALLNVQKITEINAKHWIVDTTRLTDVLGYKPEFDLDRGVEITLNWYTKEKWL